MNGVVSINQLVGLLTLFFSEAGRFLSLYFHSWVQRTGAFIVHYASY